MNGQRIKMYYDPRGQVIRTVNPDNTEQRVVFGVPVTLSEVEGFAPSPWETYSYDANDLDATSPHFATPKSAEVDALGRTIKTLDRLESSHSTSNNVQMLYEYDIRGNLLNVKDAYDRTVFEHVYDLQTPAKEGESIPPLRTTHINKGTSTVVFDCTGKPIETRDAKGALTLHGYDVLQRPIKMWCRDNNSEAVTLRQNSVFGISVDDNNNGKLLEHYDESGYEKIDTYDFKGNVLQKSKQVINNNEILNAIQNSQNNGWNTIDCYRVDWTGLNMALLSSTIFQTNMEYDGLNRLKKITYPADADNNRKELIPLYNKAGALQKVEFDGTEYVKEIAYNAKGQRLLIAYGNGLMTRYCYNAQTFRLTRLKTEGYTYTQTGNEHQYHYNAGTVKQDFAYTYDKGGNITHINDVTAQCGVGAGDELRRSFEYDALYRLLSATGRENQVSIDFPCWDDTTRSDDPNNTQEYSQTYSYDLMGNINQLQHQGTNNFTRTFTYVDSNLLKDIEVSGNTYTFEYDVCGNQIRENQERQFQWDYADRLKLYYNQVNSGQEPSTYTHYLYDAGGNRVKKLTRTQGGNWECITYIDGLIEYREDHNGQQQSISHIMDDSKRIASVRNGFDFGDSTPAIKYNMDDHLGSSNLSVDENGTLVNREEYYPFGETSFGSYSKKRYRFCGKEKDEESGLYYYGARYYSPWTCRFISVDPQAGEYIFQTPYAYADNNPICKMDYNGEGTGDGEPSGGKPSGASWLQPTPSLPVVNGVKGPWSNEYAAKVAAQQKANTNKTPPITRVTAQANLIESRGLPGGLVLIDIKPTNPKPTGFPIVDFAIASYILYKTITPIAYDFAMNIEQNAARIAKGLEYMGVPKEALEGPNPLAAAEEDAKLYPLDDVTGDRKNDPNIRWVAYTMYNPTTQKTYSGRTSGPSTMTAKEIVDARYAKHLVEGKVGYVKPTPRGDGVGIEGYVSVRGREQQLVDYYGGAISDKINYSPNGGSSPNLIRAVAMDNPRGRLYHLYSNIKFTPLHKYTGN